MARAIANDDSDPEFQLLKKFDDAWRTDLAVIRQISLQERQEEEDRIFATRLAGVPFNPIPDDRRSMAMLLDDSGNESDDKEEPTTVNNELATQDPITPYRQQKRIRKRCAVCMEYTIRTDPYLSCKHKYCINCLQELFMKSMQDETLMPPRCCQKNIPIELARLKLEERKNFDAKYVEFTTKDRLYCSEPTCSTFIPPERIVNGIGTCPNPGCEVTTCFNCKAASHGNLDCPNDETTAAVLAAAREAGWIRCYQCRAMVELTHGCFHMTCRCRAQFCYLCSVPWKSCICPQWDEGNLYAEARVRAERMLAHQMPRANNVQRMDTLIHRMANQLRANHECQHTDGWAYTSGGGKCEQCSDYLPLYLYRCYQCHFMACNRCRRNRL